MQKYEIMDVIDEGAYGIVWKAINKQNGGLGTCEVAIKEFKEGEEDRIAMQTIQRQIKMLKLLKSEYVVDIKQAFKKKGKIYVIFEYFQKNLLNLLQIYEHGIEPKLINQLVYKIIKCLHFLHSKNIIHRDVKPQNILLNADYSVLKMCDFGFARFMPEKMYDLTDYVATRWYRSPQLLVGEPYGKPADIWALGCIIGELVDGQPMFAGEDEVDQLNLICKGIGQLTDSQRQYFRNNPKFQNILLPQSNRLQSIDIRYLGKIQKNALSFMRNCLKIDAKERMTVEQALKHPYLLGLSLSDDQFTNDELNLLFQRKQQQNKIQSKSSMLTVKEEQKLIKNININNKIGLKIDTGSLVDRQIIKSQLNSHSTYLTKKSHPNINSLNNNLLQRQSQLEKGKIKKISKMMSLEKGLKINVDLNTKVHLKINQKDMQRDQLKYQLNNKMSLQNSKTKLLPQIKNIAKASRFHLNVNKQKSNLLISVFGQSKELVHNSKLILHN